MYSASADAVALEPALEELPQPAKATAIAAERTPAKYFFILLSS